MNNWQPCLKELTGLDGRDMTVSLRRLDAAFFPFRLETFLCVSHMEVGRLPLTPRLDSNPYGTTYFAAATRRPRNEIEMAVSPRFSDVIQFSYLFMYFHTSVNILTLLIRAICAIL